MVTPHWTQRQFKDKSNVWPGQQPTASESSVVTLRLADGMPRCKLYIIPIVNCKSTVLGFVLTHLSQIATLCHMSSPNNPSL